MKSSKNIKNDDNWLTRTSRFNQFNIYPNSKWVMSSCIINYISVKWFNQNVHINVIRSVGLYLHHQGKMINLRAVRYEYQLVNQMCRDFHLQIKHQNKDKIEWIVTQCILIGQINEMISYVNRNFSITIINPTYT